MNLNLNVILFYMLVFMLLQACNSGSPHISQRAPSKAPDITIIQNSENQLAIDWKVQSDADSYSLTISTSENFDNEDTSIITVEQPPYFVDIVKGRQYYFKLTANWLSEKSPATNTKIFKPIKHNPQFSTGTVFIVDENKTFVTQIKAKDSAHPSSLIYSKQGGEDADLFVIDNKSGEISFVTAPNYELPTDANGDNVYLFSVAVSDGDNAVIQNINITVTNVDDTPPLILELTSTTPMNMTQDVDFDSAISLTFNVDIDLASVTSSAVKMQSFSGDVEVDFEVVNNMINLKPKIRLSSLTEYTIELSTDILSVDGRKLVAPVSWRFTTLLDVNPPTLLPSLIEPTANANNVDTSAEIQAQFDEPILLSSLDNSFTLSDRAEGVMIEALLDYNPYTYTASLKVISQLNLLETYIATVKTGVADLSGNNLLLPFEWEFATRDGKPGNADLLERDDIGNAQNPQVVLNKNGSGFSIWKQFDGTRYDIKVRRYDASTGWGNIETLDNLNTDVNYPKITLSSNGVAMAVWTQRDFEIQADNNFYWSVFASRYDPDSSSASKWSQPEKIEHNIGNAVSADVAISSNGSAMAVWYQFESGSLGSIADIRGNRFTELNGWQSAEIVDIDEMNNSASYPKVVMNDKGNATVVWQQSINFISNIRSNHFTDASLSWIGAERIESDSGEAYRPEIAIDPYGNVRAVWSQLLNDEREVMTNIRYVGSAAWPQAATQVSLTAETGNAYSPVIAINPNISEAQPNQFIIVWEQYDSSGSRTDIWANQYNPYNQTRWLGSQKIEDVDTGSARLPKIAIDKRGNAIAVWHQSDGINQSIHFNRFNDKTESWGNADFFETNTIRDAILPHIAIDAFGRGITVWQQTDGQRSNAWFNTFE